MKTIWVIAKKDLRIFLHDRKGLVLALVLPIAIATVIGMTVGGFQKDGKQRVGLHVADLDGSEVSRKLVDDLRAMDMIDLTVLDAATFDRGALQKALTAGRGNPTLILPKGWGASVRDPFADGAQRVRPELLFDPARQVSAGALQGAVIPAVARATGEANLDGPRLLELLDRQRAELAASADMPAADKEDLLTIFDRQRGMLERALAAVPEDRRKAPLAFLDPEGGDADMMGEAGDAALGVLVEVTRVERTNTKKVSPFSYVFPGTAVMFLLFSVTENAMSLLRERRAGVLRKIAAAPVSRVHVALGKMLSMFLLSLAQLAVLFAYGLVALHLGFNGSVAGFALVCVFTAVSATGFALFIATLGDTEKQLQGLATCVILVMSALGGSMFPYDVMPSFMKTASHFTLNRWAILGMEGGLFRKLSFVEMLPSIGILVVFSAVTMFLSIRRLKLVED